MLPTGIDGIYTRTAAFETVVDALSALISRHREPGTEVLRFPPVMSRRQVEKSGYLKSFPHFLGCVCCLPGERERSPRRGRSLRGGSRLDAGVVGRRSRAQSCGLLSGLSAGREPRRSAGGRVELRCRRRLLPARTIQGPRPVAVVPHAGVRSRRHPSADRRFSPPMACLGAGLRRAARPATTRSRKPATHSSGAAAS